jgi:hypothetical protein
VGLEVGADFVFEDDFLMDGSGHADGLPLVLGDFSVSCARGRRYDRGRHR